jgi:hypothetical protein
VKIEIGGFRPLPVMLLVFVVSIVQSLHSYAGLCRQAPFSAANCFNFLAKKVSINKLEGAKYMVGDALVGLGKGSDGKFVVKSYTFKGQGSFNPESSSCLTDNKADLAAINGAFADLKQAIERTRVINGTTSLKVPLAGELKDMPEFKEACNGLLYDKVDGDLVGSCPASEKDPFRDYFQQIKELIYPVANAKSGVTGSTNGKE